MTAHLMTILIAVLLSWVSQLIHHAPVMTGRALHSRHATPAAVLTAAAGLAFLLVFAYYGALGLPRRIYPWPGTEVAALLLVPAAALLVAQAMLLWGLARARPVPPELFKAIYGGAGPHAPPYSQG